MRSETSLIQTIGRAARNAEGKVIMYADRITGSMERAIGETNRRRAIQQKYNQEHGIVPKTITKSVRDVIEATKLVEETAPEAAAQTEKIDIAELISRLKEEMTRAAKELRFEEAAKLRDKINALENPKN